MAYPDYVVMFRGRRACPCLVEWLPVFEAELLRRGVIKRNIDIAQLIGGAAASAGTHSRGGAFDIWQRDLTTIKVARQMGADATWKRTPAQGFSYHAHGVLRGCPHNAPARYQIGAVDAGYNGLGRGGRGGKDDGPRPLSGRTWKEGIAWAKAQGKPAPKPPVITPESLVYVVTADPFLWGLAKPGSGNERKVERPEGTRFTSKASAKFANGERWVQGVDGWWSHAGYLVPTDGVPEPKPPKPTVALVRYLGENLWADYGASSYASRLDELNATRHEVRASRVLGCESGNYRDGQILNREYSWGGNRAGAAGVSNDEASYVLHSGDDVRISTSIHWNPDTHRLLDEGWDHTLKSSTHDGITWSVWQNRLSGVVAVDGVLHCVPWPIGPNKIRRWNEQREKEVSLGLDVLNELRLKVAKDRKLEVVPGICGEDFNGPRTDSKYPGGDGPGLAAKAKGWTDSYVVAKKRLPAGSVGTKALIDRILVTNVGVTVREHTIVPTRKGTDHPYAVGLYLELTNRK